MGTRKSSGAPFVSTLRQVGYDDVLSIEHEDPLIDPEEGFELAAQLLHKVLIRKPPAPLWDANLDW